ncbi:MAG: hypothetical protein ACK49R_17590 [Planctomycetota bacterium]
MFLLEGRRRVNRARRRLFLQLPRSEFRVLFPFRSATPRRPIVGDKLDRYALLNSARLFAGLRLSSDFATLSGGLGVTEGRGKHLRVRHSETQAASLPEALVADLQRQAAAPNGQWPAMLSDLAEFQASQFDRLKCLAGKFVDRILCLAVCDPGFWVQDFDGRLTYLSACDPNKLSDLTGVSVIDAFPARDLAAGGSGGDLEALPLWLWLAERPRIAAQHSSGLILANRLGKATGWFLPGSDGLDEILPEIERLPLVPSQLSPDQFNAALAAFFRKPRKSSLPLKEIHYAASDPDAARLACDVAERLQIQATPLATVETTADHPAEAEVVATALLGALFVDQMPANVPLLSGATVQRLLGRITPGTPASWRNLLINMTDSHPPTMKLRDAV